MREIKFRAWDEDLEEMHSKNILLYNGKFIAIECYVGEPIEDFIDKPNNIIYPDWKLMQFTGLKDKNGKEIYEGDIVKTTKIKLSTSHFTYATIRWENGCFGYDTIYGFYSFPMYKDTEVIGNIYENPVLLK